VPADFPPYEVVIVPGRLVYEGRECRCLTDHFDRAIKISSLVPANDRAKVAAEATDRLWREWLGLPGASFQNRRAV
jgi:hypothetical protein